MVNYITAIEELWQTRDTLGKNEEQFAKGKCIIDDIISLLDNGSISVNYKKDGQWLVNEWVKKAILLSFKTSQMRIFDGSFSKWYDKIEPKFANGDEEQIKQSNSRFVPGAYIRKGAFIGKNVVVMPSFINIGAHIGDGSLIDTWATVGSCAYIGKNCHISGGTGIGGVLEPLQASPVIIEDNCFIGARSEIAEGVLVEEGSVISMGVFISASTKIVNRSTGEIIFGKVPAYSVVVPGYLPAKEHGMPGLSCAVIVKQVDQKTRQKTSINELLREF